MTPADPVAPILLSPRNVEAALGVRWRWVCELAKRNGIEIWRIGGKSLLPAGPILAALRREAEQATPAREPTEAELVAQMRDAVERAS